MNKFMTVKNHGEEKIDVSHIPSIVLEAVPTELHFKTNGALFDTPSIAIVMKVAHIHVIGEISLNTLSDCMDQLGYKIVKK